MPGSGKQTEERQQQIKELLEAGFDPTAIHRRLKVGRSSVYRMKRCLQQHGTNYMPPELNKKNGRPKVLTPEQELEVREWLRVPKNRTCYLDDLVWLIHDRFGIVCSTTTMSKMKRKWLRVIEFEETGKPLDVLTHAQLCETHPTLPLIQGVTLFPHSSPDASVQSPPETQTNSSLPLQPKSEDTSDMQIAAGAGAIDTNNPDALLDSPEHKPPPPAPMRTFGDELSSLSLPQQSIPPPPPPPPSTFSPHQEPHSPTQGSLFVDSDPQSLTDPHLLSSQMGPRIDQQFHHEITAAAAVAAAHAAKQQQQHHHLHQQRQQHHQLTLDPQFAHDPSQSHHLL